MDQMVEWVDATGYSQGERGKVEPRAWQIKSGAVNIWVSNGHIYHPGEWAVVCSLVGFVKPMGLKADIPAAEAQRLALALVRGEFGLIAADLAALP